MLNQNQIKDLIFADVTAAEAAGRPNEICYVQSMKTFYDYVVAGSAYTVNHTSILSTGNGGDTRWRARAGQYAVDAVLFEQFQRKYQSADNKTDTYNITSADFGKSLRMNSASDKIFNSPSVGASDDGARVTIEKLGAGKVTFNCADSDKVADSGPGGTVYNDIAAEIYASITLEYVHAVTTWFITSGHGTWTTTT